jgi:DNA-binding IclR family transcriptional regulator
MSGTETPDAAQARTIGAIDTGMRLLDVLARSAGPMMLKDLAAEAGMAAAKAHRYLASFMRADMVRQDGRSGRYDLGPMAVRVGMAAIGRFDCVTQARLQLPSLRDKIRASCLVAAWSDQGPIILEWADSRRPVTVMVQVGSIMPLLTSATGRAFLGFLPADMTLSLVEAEWAEMDPPGDAPSIERLRHEVRATGLGQSLGSLQDGVSALAAPLFDPLGRMVGAVAALGRADEFDADPAGPAADALRAFANGLGDPAGV